MSSEPRSLAAARSHRLYLDLLHGQVQEGVLVADADQTLGALAAHAGSQTAVQFDHGELVEAGGDVVRETLRSDLVVGLNLRRTISQCHSNKTQTARLHADVKSGEEQLWSFTVKHRCSILLNDLISFYVIFDERYEEELTEKHFVSCYQPASFVLHKLNAFIVKPQQETLR